MINWLELHQGTTATHFLESQGQAMISRLELQQDATATHFLKSQGQALLTGYNHSKALQPLTS